MNFEFLGIAILVLVGETCGNAASESTSDATAPSSSQPSAERPRAQHSPLTEAPTATAGPPATAEIVPSVEPTTAAVPAPTPAATKAQEPTASPAPSSLPSLTFGDSHSRSPGFGGEGWTVSIDEVRTIPVDFGGYPQLPCRHRHSNPRLTQRRSHLKRLQLPRSRPHPKRHRTRILQHQLRLFVTRIRRSHPSRRRRNHPRNHNQMVRNIRSKRRDLRHRRHRKKPSTRQRAQHSLHQAPPKRRTPSANENGGHIHLAIRIRDRPVSVAKAGPSASTKCAPSRSTSEIPPTALPSSAQQPSTHSTTVSPQAASASPKSSSSKTASNSNPSASAATLRHSNQKVSPEPSAPKSPKEPQSNGSQHSKQTPRPTTSSPSKKPSTRMVDPSAKRERRCPMGGRPIAMALSIAAVVCRSSTPVLGYTVRSNPDDRRFAHEQILPHGTAADVEALIHPGHSLPTGTTSS